jgi:hypothetical protein
MMAAARLPARKLSANSQLLRPSAIGRIWFSTQLLSMGKAPSSTKRVAVFDEDTEAPVLGQQQWQAVHERRARGHSISAITRELELDRKTVRSCLQQASWQPYQRAAAGSLLDPHRAWLAERTPEVNYSARILCRSCTRSAASPAAT